MEQIERIRRMEERLNRLSAWLENAEYVLAARAAAREDADALAAYLESPEWRADFEADEAGLLPPELPRGVLSEDGIYNALERMRELPDALRGE
jgi:hypothetical protein